jgi:hypothetical protein
MSELAQLMQEPPGGANHGRLLQSLRRDSDAPTGPIHRLELSAAGAQAQEFLRDGGWAVVTAKDGARGGVHSHAVNQHTVLHPDEYVDHALVAALLEDELGFTAEQVHSVYSTGGRLPSARLALRDAIDARLLALLNDGSNLALLGRLLRLEHKAVERAVARARAKEGKS